MFNLFIADDERLVIDTLTSMIDWPAHGITLAGSAANGKTACEDILRQDIDIVIVDIRMPGMSGLELIERVKAEKPDTIFIVCSGYSDFGYAREAMKHGTVYYLTKPVELDELVEAVKIAITRCEELKTHSGDQITRLKKEKMIAETLIYGQHHPECDFERFFVAFTNIEDLPDFINVIDNMIKDSLSSEACTVYLHYNQNEVILVFAETDSDSFVTQTLLRIAQELKDLLNIDIRWGIGANKPYAKDIHMSYIQSKNAFHYAVFTDRRISTIYDVIYSDNEKLEIDYAAILATLTSEDGRERSRTCIRSLIERALENRISPDGLIFYCTEMINHATNYFKQLYGIPPEELYQHNYASIKLLNEVKSARMMGEITCECLHNMVDFLNDRMKDYKDKIISQIKEYIHDNIEKSISAADLSKVVNFNPSYISNFFKKKTGVSLTDYITETKMEKAKSLLSGSVLKINKIAEAVGYDDQRYFCLVFKKYCGMTPTQFRARKKPDEVVSR